MKEKLVQSRKDIALQFEKMLIAGRIEEAYEKFISHDFKHHSPFFKGDRESLKKAMQENAQDHPDKQSELIQALEDGDLVVTYSRLKLGPAAPEMAVCHMYRFSEDNKIVEEWHIVQALPKESPNENGSF